MGKYFFKTSFRGTKYDGPWQGTCVLRIRQLAWRVSCRYPVSWLCWPPATTLACILSTAQLSTAHVWWLVVAGMQYAHTSSRLNYPALSIGRTCELGAGHARHVHQCAETRCLHLTSIIYLQTGKNKCKSICRLASCNGMVCSQILCSTDVSGW